MSNICDTQYKVRGTRKAMTDLWNTLQAMNVNTTNVYLYKLAEHYGIDNEHRGFLSEDTSIGLSLKKTKMEECFLSILITHGQRATTVY